MAVVQLEVINPTAADVTVGSNIAKAGAVTTLGVDNATADAYTFLAQGCGLCSASAGTVVSREQAGFLLYTGQAKG